MKKLLRTALAASVIFLLVTDQPIHAQSKGLTKIRCTCYIDTGITAGGVYTHDGVIAGKREWLGSVAALYRYNADGSVGEFIGNYEFLDTGAGMDTDGDGVGDSIRRGKSVDVYKSTLTEAYDWVAEYGDYVYIKIIPALG